MYGRFPLGQCGILWLCRAVIKGQGNLWLPCEIPPWNSIEILGTSMEFHRVSMEYPWHSMEFHGVSSNSMQFLGVSKKFHRMLWSSTEFHGVSMNFDIYSLQFV